MLDSDGAPVESPVYSECNDGSGTFTFFPLTNGSWTDVTVDWGDDQISVKAPKDFTGEQGDDVGVVVPRDHLFVFDESNGHRIR